MPTKQVVFHALPDWRLSGRPDDDILLTIGTNSVRVDAYVEEVESDTDGPVTTADVVKALGQVWEQVRETALHEIKASGQAIRKPKAQRQPKLG